MKKVNRLMSIVLVFVMLLMPAMAEMASAGPICDAAHAGWDAGYAAGTQMIAFASAVVNGAIHAVGGAIAATAGFVVGVVCSLGKWAKQGVQKIKKMAKKFFAWTKKVAAKVKAKFKKFWAGAKKFWKMLKDCYMTGYNSVAGGNSAPAPERVKAIKSDDFEKDMSELIINHQEARFNYATDEKYQKNFNNCAKTQKNILKQIDASLKAGDYYHYNSFMKMIKKMDTKRKTDRSLVNADDIMAFGPVLEGLQSRIRARLVSADGQEAKDLQEMLEEVNYYNGYNSSFSEKFYIKGAVKMPNLK